MAPLPTCSFTRDKIQALALIGRTFVSLISGALNHLIARQLAWESTRKKNKEYGIISASHIDQSASRKKLLRYSTVVNPSSAADASIRVNTRQKQPAASNQVSILKSVDLNLFCGGVETDSEFSISLIVLSPYLIYVFFHINQTFTRCRLGSHLTMAANNSHQNTLYIDCKEHSRQLTCASLFKSFQHHVARTKVVFHFYHHGIYWRRCSSVSGSLPRSADRNLLWWTISVWRTGCCF